MGNLRWALDSLGDAEIPSLGETVSFPLWGRDHVPPHTLYKIPLANGGEQDSLGQECSLEQGPQEYQSRGPDYSCKLKHPRAQGTVESLASS